MKMEEEEEQLEPRCAVWLCRLPFREPERSGKPGMAFPADPCGDGADPGGLRVPAAGLPAPAELLPSSSGLKTSRNLIQAAFPMAAGLFRTCFPALSPVHPLSAGGANTP